MVTFHHPGDNPPRRGYICLISPAPDSDFNVAGVQAWQPGKMAAFYPGEEKSLIEVLLANNVVSLTRGADQRFKQRYTDAKTWMTISARPSDLTANTHCYARTSAMFRGFKTPYGSLQYEYLPRQGVCFGRCSDENKFCRSVKKPKRFGKARCDCCR